MKLGPNTSLGTVGPLGSPGVVAVNVGPLGTQAAIQAGGGVSQCGTTVPPKTS
ncbi:MAG: hypothetical protein R2882_10005 [Gemmatimonadales bacterium]